MMSSSSWDLKKFTKCRPVLSIVKLMFPAARTVHQPVTLRYVAEGKDRLIAEKDVPFSILFTIIFFSKKIGNII